MSNYSFMIIRFDTGIADLTVDITFVMRVQKQLKYPI